MQIDKRASLSVSVFMILAFSAFSFGQAARADEGFNTTINGYGTIGGTYTGDGLTYFHNSSEFKATNSQFDLGIDSRIGVQATFAYGDYLSVIVQEEAKRRGSENFSLGTEWAFLQYTPIADIKLRLGRVALAAFLMSDSRDIGYAQPWFNAPNEIYGAEPFETLDGGQALWHVNLGPVGLDLEGEYGSTNQTVSGGTLTIVAKAASNVAATLTFKDFTLRIADTIVSFPLVIPLSATNIVKYQDDDKFLSAGFQYDNGKAIVLTEWIKRTENDAPVLNMPLNISSQWYVAGGWRFGKLTPLLTYTTFKPETSLTFPAGSYSKRYGTPTASLRYDIVSNVALKAQLSRPQADNVEWFTQSVTSTERVNVFSVGADFVF